MMILLPVAVVLLLPRRSTAASSAADAAPGRAARFGIITDVHYADYETVGTRYYRDSLPKVQEATQTIISSEADFMIELGDFKDTVCPGVNKGAVPANCTDATISFIDTIEGAMSAFKKPRFHVLGNHDVDVLNQSAVLAHLKNYPQGVAVAAEGHYAFGMPFPSAAPAPSPSPAPAGPDAVGCLFSDGGSNVWVKHADGTRDWLPGKFLPKGCEAKATKLSADAIDAIPKRHGATSPLYPLSEADTRKACAQDHACPTPPPAALKFLVLNGDFNANGAPRRKKRKKPTARSWFQLFLSLHFVLSLSWGNHSLFCFETTQPPKKCWLLQGRRGMIWTARRRCPLCGTMRGAKRETPVLAPVSDNYQTAFFAKTGSGRTGGKLME